MAKWLVLGFLAACWITCFYEVRRLIRGERR